MTTYQVSIEGQTIQLPAGIGEKDEDVKRAMAPFFPEVANAMLQRKTEGETVTITVVKRAGSKGLAPLAKLQAAPGGKNPAIALYEEIQALGPQADILGLLAMEPRIDTALRDGQHQRDQMNDAAKRLSAAVAQPAPVVPLGF